jgi:hypothetical protein
VCQTKDNYHLIIALEQSMAVIGHSRVGRRKNARESLSLCYFLPSARTLGRVSYLVASLIYCLLLFHDHASWTTYSQFFSSSTLHVPLPVAQMVLAANVSTTSILPPSPASRIKPTTRINNKTAPAPAATATATAAYIISITSCSAKFSYTLWDAAAVFQKSIALTSFPLHPFSKYSSHVYAILPPHLKNSTCATTLRQLGFALQIRNFPVNPKDIQTAHLKTKIAADGCCGHRELLKLYTWTFTNHFAAIHLDLDTLVLQPMDELLDVLYYPPSSPQGQRAQRHLQQGALLAPTFQLKVPAAAPAAPGIIEHFVQVDAFYTKDYNMIPPHKQKRVGVQGGFLVVRPNDKTFDTLVNMVLSGHYIAGKKKDSGWYGSGYGGHIWGSMTIQGLLAYYFSRKAHQLTSIELHRCKFNQIADNPRRSTYAAVANKNGKTGIYPRGTPYKNTNVTYRDTTCRDGRANCDDVQCQTWPMADTRLVHFTNCKVPWNCQPLAKWNETMDVETCRLMHTKWFEIRATMIPDADAGANGSSSSSIVAAANTFEPEYHLGFCTTKGSDGYIRIPQGQYSV